MSAADKRPIAAKALETVKQEVRRQQPKTTRQSASPHKLARQVQRLMRQR